MRRPDRGLLVELFATANLGFLALDVLVAHAANRFRAWPEWIPVVAAGLGATALGASLLAGRPRRLGIGRTTGLTVGGVAIAVGVAGLLWHLESRFFAERTLRSLVYSAPFAAPLAFAGVGLLVILNRLASPDEAGWNRAVIALAWGGFVGDFLLTLLDHAQNGFFYPVEWLAVGASALAVAWFGVILVRPPTRGFLLGAIWVLALQVVVGVGGWILHLEPLVREGAGPLVDRALYGPPLFAPLLLPNLALLAGIGLGGMLAAPTVG